MPITPRLSRKLRPALGDEVAEDLVNWMQQIDTQRAELRELTELYVSRLEGRMAELREATRADIAELRQETQAGLADVRRELRSGLGELGELRQELQSGLARVETLLERRTADLMKWSFVFWVGAVAAVALLAGVLP